MKNLRAHSLTLDDCLAISRTCVALNLRRADRAVTQMYDRAFRPLGLRGTQFGLLIAAQAMESAPMSMIAGTMGMDLTTLTRNLRPLERNGWLELRKGGDRRERLVTLTPRGRTLAFRARSAWRSAQGRLRGLIGDSSMKEIVDRLEALARALRSA